MIFPNPAVFHIEVFVLQSRLSVYVEIPFLAVNFGRKNSTCWSEKKKTGSLNRILGEEKEAVIRNLNCNIIS